MGGAYKDDEATRVDASVLRQQQPADVPVLIPDAEASQETARIDLNEVDRRALPFKRRRDRRGDLDDDEETREHELPELDDADEVDGMAMTGAMRPVKAPVMPFSDRNPRIPGAGPQSGPPSGPPSGPQGPHSDPYGGPQSGPASHPPSIDPAKLTPKVAPLALAPLSENPLSVWAQDAPAPTSPAELPSSLAPPAESEPLAVAAKKADNTVQIAIFGAIAVLVIGVVLALLV